MVGRPPVFGPGTAKGKAMFRRMRNKRVYKQKNTSITSIVKKIITGQEEKKHQAYTPDPQTYNSGIGSTSEWYNPIPIVNQGVGAFQRDGNVIKPLSLIMNWRVSLGTGVTRSCDDMVVLYLFKLKNARSYSDMIARGSASQFLEAGSQGLKAFTGLLQDLDLPINNDGFTLLTKRVFRLNKGLGALNGETGAYSGAGGVTSKKITVTLKNLPQFEYQQGNTDGLPENYGLCWAIGYAKTDGSSPDVINQDIRVDFTSNLYFTDA